MHMNRCLQADDSTQYELKILSTKSQFKLLSLTRT